MGTLKSNTPAVMMVCSDIDPDCKLITWEEFISDNSDEDEGEIARIKKDLEEVGICHCGGGAAAQFKIWRTDVDGIKLRMITAATAADDAFWNEVCKLFPESTTGDLDPMATARFNQAIKDVITSWVMVNVRNDI